MRVATDADMDSVLDLLRRFFVTEEPLSSTTLPVPIDPADLYSVRFLGKGLSVVATGVDGSIVGVCINTEGTRASYAERRRTKESTTNLHTKKVLTLLDMAEEGANIWNKYGVERFFDVRILTVHASFRGMGLGKALVEKSLEIAKEKRFKLAHVECTGVYSANIMETLGMECVFRIPYKEYKDHTGQPVFNIPLPHTELKLFILRL